MKFGAMNNPMVDVTEEITSFAEMGFDFVDLTLEPEQTYSARVDVDKIAGVLERAGMSAVGHRRPSVGTRATRRALSTARRAR